MGKSRTYADMEEELLKLEIMSYQELQERYELAFGEKSLSKDKDYLLRILSYRLQKKALGGLPKTTLNKLNRIAFEGQEKLQPKYHMQPGTQISREWNGRKYHVAVRHNGYEYNGQVYKSLSAVAYSITGVPWSGPLFFGIRKYPSKKDKHELKA